MELAGNSFNGAVVSACLMASFAVAPWEALFENLGGSSCEEEEDDEEEEVSSDVDQSLAATPDQLEME